MRIDHLAIWVNDLEQMKEFYHCYFGASYNERYENPNKGFSSYFMEFGLGKARIELMHRADIATVLKTGSDFIGLAHFAISLGSEEMVVSLTEKFRKDGITVVGEPRTTGDGYFESVILDPEGNTIELTV